MVTEDVQSVARYAAGGNVDNVRKKLTGDLVHIRDHKKKTLRSGVGRGKSTGCKRAVNSTCGTGLGLHFGNFYVLTEKVLRVFCGHNIGDLSHYGRGSDGIDGSNFRKRIRYVRGGVVTVHGFGFSCHWMILLVFLECNLHKPTFYILSLERRVVNIQLAKILICLSKKVGNFYDLAL